METEWDLRCIKRAIRNCMAETDKRLFARIKRANARAKPFNKTLDRPDAKALKRLLRRDFVWAVWDRSGYVVRGSDFSDGVVTLPPPEKTPRPMRMRTAAEVTDPEEIKSIAFSYSPYLIPMSSVERSFCLREGHGRKIVEKAKMMGLI